MSEINPIIVTYENGFADDMPALVCTEIGKLNFRMVVAKYGKRADEIYKIVSEQDGLEKHDARLQAEAVDEFVDCLKNPITLDALVSAKDKFTVIAILKRQAEQLKEQKE